MLMQLSAGALLDPCRMERMEERRAHKSEEELRSRKKRRSKEKKRGRQVKSRSEYSKKRRYELSDSSVDSYRSRSAATSDRSHTPSRSKHGKKAKSRSKSSKKKRHRYDSSDSDSSSDSSDGDRSPAPSKQRKPKRTKHKHKRKKSIQDKKWAPANIGQPTTKLRVSAGEGASKVPSVSAEPLSSEGSSKGVTEQGNNVNLKAVLAAQTSK